MRVLKPSGSIWVNLGDKYGRPGGGADVNPRSLVDAGDTVPLRQQHQALVPTAAVVEWSKPNGLPESVTDRVRRSHEDWVHLVKQPRYYSAVDEIRTSVSGYTRPGRALRATPGGQRPRTMTDTCNPLGALPGSVWTIPTEPLTVPDHLGIDHFAAFPTELPRRIILGWSPSGICTVCGEGRRPVVAKQSSGTRADRSTTWIVGSAHHRGDVSVDRVREINVSATITGYACACPAPSAPTRPAIVVDPFGGTGTTALVASVLGRIGISIDMSADYCRLAQWRTNDRGQIAKAMRVPKPEPVAEDQLSLFGLEVGHA